MFNKPWQLFALGMAFAMLFGMVGSFDYHEEKASEQLYCAMIQEGTWPAYDNSIDCVNGDSEKAIEKDNCTGCADPVE